MEELNLEDLLMLFWNKKIKILLIIAIFILIGIIYTIGFVTPVYTSSTTLVLAKAENSTTQDENTITTTDITINSKLVSTYSEIVKSKNIMRQVISNLGIDLKESELRKNIKVSSVKDTELIEISVTNENAANASKIANEIAKVFTAKVSEIYNINNVYVLDEAETSNTPSNLNHVKNVMIFAFVGVVVSVMYVLLINILDTTIKSSEEIEKDFKIPVLATIPMYNFENDKGGKIK